MATRPRTYAEFYAHVRERAEARPDAKELRATFARMFHRPEEHGAEAWYWDTSRGEPVQIRSYDTECGVRVYHPETIFHGGYEWIVPQNTVSFGNTGGDGCHFSFITTPDGRWSARSPVVLIVPAAHCRETGVVVVGGDLWDFLEFGLRTGYFVLENLAWSFDEFLAEYPDRDPVANAGDLQQTELAALAESFGLKGWDRNEIGPRLAQLRAQFYPQLVFAPDEHCS